MPNTAYSANQKRKKISSLLSVFSIFLILLIDQASKFLISSSLSQGQSIPIIKGVLHITFVKNTGAAFGLLKNSTYFFILVSVAAVVVIGAILIRSLKSGKFLQNPLFNFSLILIISGAIGNLIDRVRFLYVIDFIDFRIWPVFNVADSAITIGTVLLIFSLSKKPPQPNRLNLRGNLRG
ncbi:MAG: signal peptidase II [Candidatus Omnitrophota bacterium]|nr:signal peptidase II [Candidatus Omnitrophota bacterium]